MMGFIDSLIIFDMSYTLYILLDMVAKNLIGIIPTKEKLGGANYDHWHIKVQFTMT